MNEQAAAWLSCVDGLPAVHDRLKRVVILNQDALEVIGKQDGPRTLFYLDPPYHKDTRTAKDVYKHEMSDEQHVELLRAVNDCEGKVMISGYHCDLYDGMLSGDDWKCHEFDLPNNAAGGKEKRRMTECLWVNY